jgi:hypothetical protein
MPNKMGHNKIPQWTDDIWNSIDKVPLYPTWARLSAMTRRSETLVVWPKFLAEKQERPK